MDRIQDIAVHLVSTPIRDPPADSTRRVDRVGFVVVEVFTDSGLRGIGVTYNEVGGEATGLLIEKSIAPYVRGRAVLETERIWSDLIGHLRGVGRKGLTLAAISAVDIALWDLKGKLFNVPVFRLLGGNRTKVPIYASGGWTSYSDDELVVEAEKMVARGYSKIKVKVGVERGRNPSRDIRRIARVRDAVGPDVVIMLDANNCWDAATATWFANRVRDLNITFLEEPVPADDLPGLVRYKRSTDLPLATGEHEYTKFGARDLVSHDAVDYLQLDAARAGGYTEMVKVAAIAQAWNIPLAPHAMELVHLNFAATFTEVVFLERLLIFEELTNNLFVNAPVPVDGFITTSETPGLGLEIDMDFLRRTSD